MKKILMVFIIVLIFPVLAFSHPGRTASDGCHYCRTNCGYWGVGWYVRHCHNKLDILEHTINASQPVGQDISEVLVDIIKQNQEEDLAKDAMGQPMGNLSGFFSRGGLLGILNKPDSFGDKAEQK